MSTIYGDDYANSLYGTTYDDYIYAYDGDDYVFADSGNDYVDGWYGDDTFYGSYGNDTLYGWYGDDNLYGSYGNDYLSGEDGNDLLDGFSGDYNWEKDTLVGGAGSDTFVLGRGDGICYLGGLSGDVDDSYALITDWDPYADYIQAYGNQDYYTLSYGYWLGGSAQDTGIYHNNDLIGVIQDSTDVSFTRDFKFVQTSVLIDNGTALVPVYE